MFLSLCTRCNTNINHVVDGPDQLTRWTDALLESSYHSTRASKEILSGVSRTLDAWTQTFADHEVEVAYFVAANTTIEDEEPDLDLLRDSETKYATQEFLICSEARAKVAGEMENLTSWHCIPALDESAEDKLLGPLQSWYNTVKAGVKTG